MVFVPSGNQFPKRAKKALAISTSNTGDLHGVEVIDGEQTEPDS